ncbi:MULTISPECIES: hypothetical protein [Rhodopseudomonas]|uniref:Uncharacterized protein n=1 Tax=Rhodopseudomonas palustris (strain DX-1) TaxID=652103 RepID=E6VG20_RHOPX|nr:MULTISPECIES: hypothetical protein [Rhodopseudomonas]NEW90238.1 hypothetical protein [Rhodopseudomonas sp. WA056]QDL99249.1 hypothetical protein FLL57_18910 [Rhodopseudomonas palustris]
MTQITKVYQDAGKAQAAVAELKAASFSNAAIASTSKDGTVVTVDPPFGKGGQADAILNRHGPSRDTSGYGSASLTDSSARLTGAPRLTDSRTTLGGIFPELTSPNFFLSSMFGPLLAASQKPWSSLASSQKPWSSLAKSQDAWSSLASNQKASAQLINNPAPFSSMLGLPVLAGR